MDILAALKQEEAKLQQQLRGIQGAIAALNGARHAPSGAQPVNRKRTMSAAARAKISKATKARWKKVRAEKAKKD
jgi:hypothetical protein